VTELRPTDLKRLHREWRRKTPGRLDLVLDGIQGPFNVGGIIRTAAAYRVHTIWLVADATGPDNTKVGKTALGTDRYIQFERRESPDDAVTEIAADGLRMVSLELADDAVALHEADLEGDIALVLGNEDHGVSKTLLAASSQVAFAPQLGKVGSLNVSAVTAIGCHEWARHRWVT
jgi:tRNA (guanosine-2'-O-)-methyltransferase